MVGNLARVTVQRRPEASIASLGPARVGIPMAIAACPPEAVLQMSQSVAGSIGLHGAEAQQPAQEYLVLQVDCTVTRSPVQSLVLLLGRVSLEILRVPTWLSELACVYQSSNQSGNGLRFLAPVLLESA